MSKKIVFQGLKGSYSEQALKEYAMLNKLDIISVESLGFFKNLFEAIENLGLGFIPIENSYAGSVVQVYDLLLEYDFKILGEYIFNVNHFLVSKKGLKIEDIKYVYSHPQALMQCSKFIEKNNFSPISYDDTAGAAKFVSLSTENNLASISSESSAKIYGLDILAKKIQDSDDNQTRFLLVKKNNFSLDFEDRILEKKNKSTIIIKTRNIPGALYKCLGAFATNSINLSKLESRPSKKKNFDYIFYIDFEASLDEERVKLALDEIKFFTQDIKILGSYKKFEL